jgi:hypothetical protein
MQSSDYTILLPFITLIVGAAGGYASRALPWITRALECEGVMERIQIML